MVTSSLTSSVHIFSPADTVGGGGAGVAVVMTQEKVSASLPVWGLPGVMIETDPCESDKEIPWAEHVKGS